MTNARTKGVAAEREVFKIISDVLNIEVKRNLVQTREGGYDAVAGEFAIECKRQETLRLSDWWSQAVNQAIAAKKMPMLIYRQSRQPWRVRVWARDYLAIHGVNALNASVLEMDLLPGVDLIGMTLQKNC